MHQNKRNTLKVSDQVRVRIWFVPTIFLIFQFNFVLSVSAQNKPCLFDENSLQFAGNPVEQARCLLRPNGFGGALEKELKKLPSPLEKLIGKPLAVSKQRYRKYLLKHGIKEDEIGGDLDASLAAVRLPNGVEIPTLYFIIHDTSWPYLKDFPFPIDFDSDKQWKGNDLSIWKKQTAAHIFVNRLGESVTTTPFDQILLNGFGTKFARRILQERGKGLQLHIELIQPRRRDAANSLPENDLIAPTPGFTRQQYDRLAILYIAAGLRRGTWLIPAYHSAIDAGIEDAHDDPQNFELRKFAKSLNKIIKNVG